MKNILLTLLIFSNLAGQTIDVGIFNHLLMNGCILKINSGKYLMIVEDTVATELEIGDQVLIYSNQDRVEMVTKNGLLYKSSQVQVSPIDDSGLVSIVPINETNNRRKYQYSILIRSRWKTLQLINRLPLDEYLTGVVESEGGPNAGIEYYRAQSILCRTYTIQNLGRHSDEQFNLCDGVHCQAFHGYKPYNHKIHEAVWSASGKILTDKDTILVLAAFHASCGGITETAGNIWGTDKPYLKSIADIYCKKQNNAAWTYTINKPKWINYLSEKTKLSPEIVSKNLNPINCTKRCKELTILGEKIKFSEIRNDWGLKSSFFSVKIQPNLITIEGRGFGHGVGMCQEGAMQMDRLGKNHKEIINFYFDHVYIYDLKEIENKIKLQDYINK